MEETVATSVAAEVLSALSAIARARRLVDNVTTDDELGIQLRAFLTATAASLHTGVSSMLVAAHPSLASFEGKFLEQMGISERASQSPPSAVSESELADAAISVRDTWIEATVLLSETFRALKSMESLPGGSGMKASTAVVIADINALLDRLEAAHPAVKSTAEDYARVHAQVAARRDASDE